ncbi:hypothetical protein FGO68_gene17273 [Halteria grandinella]|uniref:Uncharacterized protein n=1 Tax=Halteria grandinella TaxID=5974 RepID=A0A8J8NNS7_HALGN|nr:hypothetical protein FGO68_gene17273 [Halteria grandinella]
MGQNLPNILAAIGIQVYQHIPFIAKDKFYLGGLRPVEVHFPAGYDPTAPNGYPLLIMLHGFNYTNQHYEQKYFKFGQIASDRGFVYVYPTGFKNPEGSVYWKATDACCDVPNTGISDALYLKGLIKEAQRKLNIDEKKVYLIGHSNGGFMAYRMACDYPTLIAGIVSVAGETYLDNSMCKNAGKASLNVLQIQGDLDVQIYYDGGTLYKVQYPGALQTVATWAENIGCTGTTLVDSGNNFDLDMNVAGAETIWYKPTACPAGFDVDFWKVVGANHSPKFTDTARAALFDWFEAHPRP